MTKEEAVERFWSKVEKTETCWLWKGSVSASGYGSAYFMGAFKKPHQIAYELHAGRIESGLTIDHLCRVRNCVNPAHLEAVSRAENARRARNHCKKTRGERCLRGHSYAVSGYIRNGKIHCRACMPFLGQRWRRNYKHLRALLAFSMLLEKRVSILIVAGTCAACKFWEKAQSKNLKLFGKGVCSSLSGIGVAGIRLSKRGVEVFKSVSTPSTFTCLQYQPI